MHPARATNRASVLVIVLIAVALLGGGAWLVKPSWFPGSSRRAANSTKATANLVAAVDAQAASAAAGVATIGKANAEAPASPSKDFITQEVPAVLAKLPAPDPMALLEAEKRRSAVMEGRADEARRLYETEAKKAERLQAERDEAIAARQKADLEIEKQAAVDHANTVRSIGLVAIIVVLVAAWLWLKFNTVGTTKLGKMAADIRAGENPLTVLDRYVDERLHSKVMRVAKANTDLPPAPLPPTAVG